jgi:uncharacterized protein HemX
VLIPALASAKDLGLALAYLQDAGAATPVDTTSTLVSAIVNALTIGGGLAVAGAFLFKRADKYLDARDARVQAEREEDREERVVHREERERIYNSFTERIAIINKQRDEILAKYVELQQRNEALHQSEREAWRTAYEGMSTRYEALVTQVLNHQSPAPPPTPGPR